VKNLHREVGYWVSVALIAIVGIALFKVIAIRVGDRFPALLALANFV
jgi:hypothetical protein